MVALDVGHGQLHERLRADQRVTVLERTNLRHVDPAELGAFPAIVADLSFIPLATALPPALALARPRAVLVALIKPQFEVGPAHVGKGGIVRDPAAIARARAGVREFLDGAGWATIGEAESPIAGGDGNREYLIAARKV